MKYFLNYLDLWKIVRCFSYAYDSLISIISEGITVGSLKFLLVTMPLPPYDDIQRAGYVHKTKMQNVDKGSKEVQWIWK